MRVYHRTTHEAATAILADRRFLSRERGEVCVSDRRDGYADGYGPAVVVLDVPDNLLTLDDEFQDGEQHFRVRAVDIRPEFVIGVAS